MIREAIRRLRRAAFRLPLVRRTWILFRRLPPLLARDLRTLGKRRVWRWELSEVEKVAHLYQRGLDMKNRLQPEVGRNFLDYPAAGGIEISGQKVGWLFHSSFVYLGESFPSFQMRTDLEHNLPLIFDHYRPQMFIDMGTAFGATALLAHREMTGYERDPVILSVDVEDVFAGSAGPMHRKIGSPDFVTFLLGDSVSPYVTEQVASSLEENADKRVLLSLDDDHSAEHVLTELQTYAPLLKAGDVIVVQDTWDQGLRGWKLSPLLAVLRFLNTNAQFNVDQELLKKIRLPCSFIHGVLIKHTIGVAIAST